MHISHSVSCSTERRPHLAPARLPLRAQTWHWCSKLSANCLPAHPGGRHWLCPFFQLMSSREVEEPALSHTAWVRVKRSGGRENHTHRAGEVFREVQGKFMGPPPALGLSLQSSQRPLAGGPALLRGVIKAECGRGRVVPSRVGPGLSGSAGRKPPSPGRTPSHRELPI